MLQRHCLNQKELARRWGISHRTLERWRYGGQGPAFLKLGGRVLYRLADIEAFEQSQLQLALKISEAVARVGHTPRRLTAKGLVHLVQERVGPDRFAYIAVARPRPKAAAPSLSALLLEERAA